MLDPRMAKLQNSLSCCTFNGGQHSHILIKEDDASAKLKKVTLLAAGGDWISFNPDEGRKCKRLDKKSNLVLMSPLLSIDGHEHHRACDCVVVVNRNGSLTILYIDLKSANPIGYSGQFKSTRRFVRYAIDLQAEFHESDLKIAEEKYVIIYGGQKRLIGKKTTVQKLNSATKSRPDAARKIEVENASKLYLKQLLE